MSALGQKQTFNDVRRKSALPPKADIKVVPLIGERRQTGSCKPKSIYGRPLVSSAWRLKCLPNDAVTITPITCRVNGAHPPNIATRRT